MDILASLVGIVGIVFFLYGFIALMPASRNFRYHMFVLVGFILVVASGVMFIYDSLGKLPAP